MEEERGKVVATNEKEMELSLNFQFIKNVIVRRKGGKQDYGNPIGQQGEHITLSQTTQFWEFQHHQ